MTKTYFMKTFNINLNLFLLSLLGFFITLISGVFTEKIGTLTKIAPLSKIPIYFKDFHKLSLMVTLLLFLSLVILATVEIVTRIAQDFMSNYWNSIFLTLKFRRFGVQSERIKRSTTDNQGKVSINPIYHDFNKAIKKSVVDISNNEVLMFIKVPHSQQAQKILKDMEELLKEEISSQNPDYYFSKPERIKNGLWFTGTKR
ncbi:hypothetical protein [Pseudolactococcus laudensis]|uniref:hypothetical protein n=1 Tax=Pseudolactococcus laudensis TaxID=1494461 RepID=UPI0002775440|nr:hypothetical protein BN193_05700 [Lactococcus raffinolactis 4877]